MSRNSVNNDIHRAAYYGHTWTVRQLIAAGHSINALNDKGNTPIMVALLGPTGKKTKGEMLHLLLNNGADVNTVNEDGDSTLHVAVRATTRQFISKKFIHRLLDYGADATLLNKSGQTARQLAYQLGSAKIGNTLLFYNRNADRVNLTKKRKEPGLIGELFGCMFPTSAFVRHLQDDFEELAIRKEEEFSSSENEAKCNNGDSQVGSKSDMDTLLDLDMPDKANGTSLSEDESEHLIILRQHTEDEISDDVINERYNRLKTIDKGINGHLLMVHRDELEIEMEKVRSAIQASRNEDCGKDTTCQSIVVNGLGARVYEVR